MILAKVGYNRKRYATYSNWQFKSGQVSVRLHFQNIVFQVHLITTVPCSICDWVMSSGMRDSIASPVTVFGSARPKTVTAYMYKQPFGLSQPVDCLFLLALVFHISTYYLSLSSSFRVDFWSFQPGISFSNYV